MKHALAIRLPDISEWDIVNDDQMSKTIKQLELSALHFHKKDIAEILTWCDETFGYLPNPEMKVARDYVTCSLHCALVLQFNSGEDRLHYLMSRNDNVMVLER